MSNFSSGTHAIFIKKWWPKLKVVSFGIFGCLTVWIRCQFIFQKVKFQKWSQVKTTAVLSNILNSVDVDSGHLISYPNSILRKQVSVVRYLTVHCIYMALSC